MPILEGNGVWAAGPVGGPAPPASLFEACVAKVGSYICVAVLAVVAFAITAVGVSAQSAGATVQASVTILEPVTVTASLVSLARNEAGAMQVDGRVGVNGPVSVVVSGAVRRADATRRSAAPDSRPTGTSAPRAVSVALDRDAAGPVTIVYTVAVVF